MGAVIIQGRVDDVPRGDARGSTGLPARIAYTGGTRDYTEGYFVEPTVIDDRGPRLPPLRDELFGPIVTTYVYDEKRWTTR